MGWKKGTLRSPKFQDLTGRRFGRWRVQTLAGSTHYANSMWHCVCDCGNVGVVRSYCLLKATSNSCGCLAHELSSLRLSGTPSRHPAEYRIWRGIKNRCLNPNVWAYSYYGGRGIKICDRWLESFDAFLDDIGPNPKHEIDRFPNMNGDYEPSNCRWATRLQQARNKRNNRLVTHDGQTKCVAEWAADLGISYAALAKRLLKNGWNIADALTTPPRPMKPQDAIAINGETRTLTEWCQHLGLSYATLHKRIGRGWPVEKILTQPPRVRRRKPRGQ
jgi:hypothetical protein